MDIVFESKDISKYNIFFLETKKNIIMNGKFTKLVYSDDNVILNGIYILFPSSTYTIERINIKIFLHFSPIEILQWIQSITTIENDILMNYKNAFGVSKTPVYLLSNQLYNGNIKVFNEIDKRVSSPSSMNGNSLIKYSDGTEKYKKYILKISGVWENEENVGLSYKLYDKSGKIIY